jgi:hypothetical protein
VTAPAVPLAPTWLRSPLVFCVLVPPGDQDEPGRVSAWMARNGRPGWYDVLSVLDPRFPEAVTSVIDGLLVHGKKFLVVDRRMGKLRVEVPSQRKLQVRYVRVVTLRGMTPPGNG